MPNTRPPDEPADRPPDRPTDRPTARPTAQPTDPLTDRPLNRQPGRPTARPPSRPTGRSPDESVGRPQPIDAAPDCDRLTARPPARPPDLPTDLPTARELSCGSLMRWQSGGASARELCCGSLMRWLTSPAQPRDSEPRRRAGLLLRERHRCDRRCPAGAPSASAAAAWRPRGASAGTGHRLGSSGGLLRAALTLATLLCCLVISFPTSSELGRFSQSCVDLDPSLTTMDRNRPVFRPNAARSWPSLRDFGQARAISVESRRISCNIGPAAIVDDFGSTWVTF